MKLLLTFYFNLLPHGFLVSTKIILSFYWKKTFRLGWVYIKFTLFFFGVSLHGHKLDNAVWFFVGVYINFTLSLM